MENQKPTFRLKKIDAAAIYAAEIAASIAPLLREIKSQLENSGDTCTEVTASYALLVAAVGFLTEEIGYRRIAATEIREIADAIEHDLVEGQFF